MGSGREEGDVMDGLGRTAAWRKIKPITQRRQIAQRNGPSHCQSLPGGVPKGGGREAEEVSSLHTGPAAVTSHVFQGGKEG